MPIFKTLLPALCLAFVACLAAGCSSKADGADRLAGAEDAFVLGQYDKAQTICDSLVASPEYDSLRPEALCRLSLLMMKLAETNGDFDSNTAVAARALAAADAEAPDSTAAFFATVSVEDRARLAILSAIIEAQKQPVSADSLIFTSDMPENE